jgi:hypothetical protein
MERRARALLQRAEALGEVPVRVAELAEVLAREFPDHEKAEIVDNVARIAVTMGLSVEFGKPLRP